MDPEQLQQQFDNLWAAIGALQKLPPDHVHSGFDLSAILFQNISQKKVWIPHTIYGTDAATAGNYKSFFIVPVAAVVTGFTEVHTVLGTDGSAVTLQLEKLTSTQAPGSGVNVLATALSLKATINSVQTATITATAANRTLAMNDRLAFLLAGTPTAVANVTGIVELTLV